ncbi:MAG: YdbL family protein, partial [Xanthomonadales bacterium]|nr:YdbL family protein [Xanthomonadales bacterium]
EIQAIQQRMADRFDASLRAQFDAGALGFGSDGMLVVRDAAAVPLRERSALNQAVADDNRDRKAVYREIAVANGHPEWEQQIRETFAKQWIASAKAGWWYQTSAGDWKQK